MIITGLIVHGYGAWSDLRIEKLSDGLNVLYGPNEAGKTTLLQFIRSMFYGFSPARRRYLPPVHGGRGGGVVDLSGPHGRFAVSRLGDGESGEQVVLSAPDGTRQGEHFIKVLLSNIDEPVFNNVFAVGLREIQELATLGDTEAAELLYSLSAGLDRVSLIDVLAELETSRNRLLDASGRPCQIGQLMAEREALVAEIEELGSINRRYGQLAVERDRLCKDIVQCEEESQRIDNQARTVELALALSERWAQRASLDAELSVLGELKAMPPGAIERLDALNARIQNHQERIDQLAQRRGQAKREFDSLKVNESLWRQAARIEALAQQEPWIAQLQTQIGQLQGEIDAMQSQLAAERERLGLKSAAPLPELSGKTLRVLRSPAAQMRQCRARLNEVQAEAHAARQSADALDRRIDAALAADGHRDLTSALDEAGGLVAQWRRRAQLDERLDQLTQHQNELEERSRRLTDRQLLPLGVLAGLGAVFILGVVLILAGLFMPTAVVGQLGLVLAVLGVAGAGAALGGKLIIERTNVHQLDACQKQFGVLRMQIEQTKADRDALDSQLPRGGGSIAARLQEAERRLAALEELSPLDARRTTARQEMESAARKVEEAENELRSARRRWRDALAAAGLPEEVGPKQLRRIAHFADRMAESHRRLERLQEDLSRRQSELESIASRIAQLATDAGLSLGSNDPIVQLRALAEAAAQQEAAAGRRDALRGEARRIRIARAKREAAVESLKHRRRLLFLEAGVQDEGEFRRRALDAARAEMLRGQRDALSREIQAAVGSQCPESAIQRLLDGPPHAAPLESPRDQLRQRHAALQQQLRETLERSGRLGQQLDAMAPDRRLAEKSLDLAVVEKRLDDAIRRWRVLAATCRLLDTIRSTYEKHRQPETLQEASGYLERLTQGRYRRVWTPLGRHVLMVDDAEGHALPVEVLSRGTREQLFLALRLALARCYGRRGAAMPLVLDDVLVNFDAERAKAAAAVLRDFAAEGHQLLVFTCHEHLLKLFQSLRLPVGRLPSNTEPGQCVSLAEQEKPKRPRAARQPRAKAAARKPEPPPDDEDAENDLDDALWEGAEKDDEEPDDSDSVAASG